MNDSGNIQTVQDGLFINMDLFSDTVQNLDESGLFLSLMAKTMEQTDLDDGFFFDVSEEDSTPQEDPASKDIIPAQLINPEQKKEIQHEKEKDIDIPDENNTLAWIDFAMKTEAELLKTMVMNKTCIPVPQAHPVNAEALVVPGNHKAVTTPETEEPTQPEYEDWQWIPVGEPSISTPVPDFSEPKDADPAWNLLYKMDASGVQAPEMLKLQELPAMKTVPAYDLQVPMENPEWGEHFKEHIVWMGQQGIQKAVIRLHPEHLGNLEIDIHIQKNGAALHIVSQHESARELLIQTLPQLQETLGEQGVTLSEVNIETRQESSDAYQKHQQQAFENKNQENPEIANPLTVQRTQDGLVDYFV